MKCNESVLVDSVALLVESVPLGGELAVRVFEYMSSPPVFALLDPLSGADTHREPPLLSVDWAHGSIEVRHAAASLFWPLQDMRAGALGKPAASSSSSSSSSFP
ncbi:hypothetical protein B484DRAFT_426131 [Ochromonadaceae sp. CCMP2298]|nr:hypothetical protein B484DRAFT_426131 [Ochromonadaceae sp. CCMP2298]